MDALRRRGHLVGMSMLATLLNEDAWTVEEEIEPWLIASGLVDRTRRDACRALAPQRSRGKVGSMEPPSMTPEQPAAMNARMSAIAAPGRARVAEIDAALDDDLFLTPEAHSSRLHSLVSRPMRSKDAGDPAMGDRYPLAARTRLKLTVARWAFRIATGLRSAS